MKWIRDHSHLNLALIDQTMVSGSNFLSGILLARYLGIEEFGRFTLAWLGIELLLSLQNTAIIAPMMTLGPKQSPSDRRMYYGAVRVQQLCAAIALTILVCVALVTAHPLFPQLGLDRLGLPLICALLASQYQIFLRRYFFTQSRAATALACDIVRYPSQLLIIIYLVLFHDMDSVAALWVIAGVATLSCLFAAFRIERLVWDPTFLAETTRRNWEFSKWLISGELLRLLTQNLFMIVAGTLLGAAAVGALKASQQLLGVVNIIQFGLDNVVPIRAATLAHQNGRAALVSYILRFALFGGLAVSLIVGLVGAFPLFWLGLFYGSEFLDYGYLVQWWSVIFLVAFLGTASNYGLRALERTRLIFLAQVFTATFAAIFSYPLVAHLALPGVMIGLISLHMIRTSITTVGFGRAARR